MDSRENNENDFKLSHVGGLEKEIEMLKEFFINPFKFSELYEKIGKILN